MRESLDVHVVNNYRSTLLALGLAHVGYFVDKQAFGSEIDSYHNDRMVVDFIRDHRDGTEYVQVTPIAYQADRFDLKYLLEMLEPQVNLNAISESVSFLPEITPKIAAMFDSEQYVCFRRAYCTFENCKNMSGFELNTRPYEDRVRRRVRGSTSSSILRRPSVFSRAAEDYVRWLEHAAIGGEPVNMRELHGVLARLQLEAAQLPALAPSDEPSPGAEDDHAIASDLTSKLALKLPVEAYSHVFDPLNDEKGDSLMTTLSDDLRDIYRDLHRGLDLYRAGNDLHASWEWHSSYFTHWGRHLTHAQSAIWQYLSEGNWS